MSNQALEVDPKIRLANEVQKLRLRQCSEQEIRNRLRSVGIPDDLLDELCPRPGAEPVSHDLEELLDLVTHLRDRLLLLPNLLEGLKPHHQPALTEMQQLAHRCQEALYGRY